ncbi:MAG: LamG-like jellyroll fold domain-containing protein [Verrucomicrobiota bacterium]
MKRCLLILILLLPGLASAQFLNLADQLAAFSASSVGGGGGGGNGLLQSLAAYYPMDDAGGGLVDVTGNGWDAADGVGESYAQSGILGTAVDFMGNTVGCNTPMQYDGGAFTMNVWMQVYAPSYDPAFLYGIGSDGTGFYYRDYALVCSVGESYHMLHGYPDGFFATLTDTSWHMVTVVLQANGEMVLYIDGTLQTEENGNYVVYGDPGGIVAPQPQTDGGMSIGNRYSGPADGSALGGYMDELGMWNRPLSQADVTALYNAGSGLAVGAFTL